jgi:L-threonylcarbamoyladenylate synthase
VSPTTAAHVAGEFGSALLILDGGACEVGIESTIVDCTRGVPVLLRPGQISRERIQAACGLNVLSKDEQISPADKASRTQGALKAPAPRASGTLESHYAPRAKVRLFTAQDVQDKLASTQLTKLALYTRSDVAAKPGLVLHMRRMPHNADACAHELFAVLRELDDLGAQEIWVETPPPDAAWEGVRDRLTRAAA